MLGAPSSSRALSFGFPGGNSGWAADFVPTLFPSQGEKSAWDGHSICGVPSGTTSRILFVPGNSHTTVQGFEVGDVSRNATSGLFAERCFEEVSHWLRPPLTKVVGGPKRFEDRSGEPARCDFTHIDGEHYSAEVC